MPTIKKYANGRFYDTVNKKYITKDQLAALIEREKEVKVVLSKSGIDITQDVLKQLTNRSVSDPKVASQSNNLKRWFGAQVDKRLDTILALMNFPKKEQVNTLLKTMDTIARRVDDIHRIQIQKMEAVKTAKTSENNQCEQPVA
jgi:hypothetical protein